MEISGNSSTSNCNTENQQRNHSEILRKASARGHNRFLKRRQVQQDIAKPSDS